MLGYIFEKYVNQKQMGAYYTKEDITGHISRNTVIPFLFDAARKECPRYGGRMIPQEWVELAVAEPALRTADPNDSKVERFFRAIPEHGDRILRVAVNTRVAPWRVVSVFFDRSMRGEL